MFVASRFFPTCSQEARMVCLFGGSTDMWPPSVDTTLAYYPVVSKTALG